MNNGAVQTPQACGAACSAKHYLPRVDIYESEKELTLCADLPGVHPENLDLRFEKGELILHGKTATAEPKGSWLLNESEAGDFYRVFQIDESIDSGKIEAEFKQGVLVVHLPKQEETKPKQVAVKVG